LKETLDYDKEYNPDNMKNVITNIYIKVNDELIDITTLPREEYEEFLESMHRLRLAYMSAIRNIDKTNKLL